MDDGVQPVTDGAKRNALWRTAKGIHIRSAGAAIVLALLGVVL